MTVDEIKRLDKTATELFEQARAVSKLKGLIVGKSDLDYEARKKVTEAYRCLIEAKDLIAEQSDKKFAALRA